MAENLKDQFAIIRTALRTRGFPDNDAYMAKVLGIAPSTISRWISGETNPRDQQRQALLLLSKCAEGVLNHQTRQTELFDQMGQKPGLLTTSLVDIPAGFLMLSGFEWLVKSMLPESDLKALNAVFPDAQLTNQFRLILTGHVKAGKTSEARTLLRKQVGKVGVEAHATKKPEVYRYWQMTLTDPPGFTAAKALQIVRIVKRTFEDSAPERMHAFLEEAKISEFDLAALEALETSHFALYVTPLTVAPDDGHRAEIKLIREVHPQMIALLNMGELARKAEPAKAEEKRQLWLQAFRELGVTQIIDFDAWHVGLKNVKELFAEIRKQLCAEDRKLIDTSLAELLDGQRVIRKKAAGLVSDLIIKCRTKCVIRSINALSGQTEVEVRRNLEGGFAEAIKTEFGSFSESLASLYATAYCGSQEVSPPKAVTIRHEINNFATATVAAASALYGGGAAVGLGAVLGGIVGFLTGGGLGAGPGMELGAKVFGLAGAAVSAFLGIAATKDGDLEATLSDVQLANLASISISMASALSNHGFAAEKPADPIQVELVKSRVNQIVISHWPVHLQSDTGPRIAVWTESVLNLLDGEPALPEASSSEPYLVDLPQILS